MLTNQYVGVHVGMWSESNKISVEGWLRGEIPEGYLLALDIYGNDVRLMPHPVSIAYHWDQERAKFAIDNGKELDEALEQLDNELRPRMDHALRALDYRRLRRFSEKAPSLEQVIEGRAAMPDHLLISDGDRLLSYLSSRAEQAVELHADVFDELEYSELTSIVSDFGPRLARLPQAAALPRIDTQFVRRGDWLWEPLEVAAESAWTVERHRTVLANAQSMKSRLVDSAVVSRRTAAEEGRKEEPTRSGSLLQWCGAGLRILAGTGLTVGNAALGIMAGLTSTITIGATAVPAYVGVATSVYTGLTQVAEGLEKVAKIGAPDAQA